MVWERVGSTRIAPGVRWEDDLPVPVFGGGDVVDVLSKVEKWL